MIEFDFYSVSHRVPDSFHSCHLVVTGGVFVRFLISVVRLSGVIRCSSLREVDILFDAMEFCLMGICGDIAPTNCLVTPMNVICMYILTIHTESRLYSNHSESKLQ